MKRIRGNSHRLLVPQRFRTALATLAQLEVSVRPARMTNMEVLNKINISK